MSEKVKPGEIEINSTEELNEKLEDLVKDPSLNKPSEEETIEAQKDFEAAAKDFTIKMYQIGTMKEAQEFHDYIKHYIENRFLWQKEAWMGTIKLIEELEACEAIFKGDKEKGLNIGYQALEFVVYALSNPGGLGLKAALDFEEENEIYLKVLEAANEQAEKAREVLKEIEFLQQRWGAMAQGFYLEIEPGEDEELPEGVVEEIDVSDEVDKAEKTS